MFRKIIVAILLIFTVTTSYAKVPQQTADSIANLLNNKEEKCDKSCPLFASENSNSGLVNTIFIDLLVAIGTVWLYSNYKKKYFFIIGSAVVITVSASHFLSSSKQCIEYNKPSCPVAPIAAKATQPKDTVKASTGDLSDFETTDSSNVASTDSSTTTAALSDFSNVDTPKPVQQTAVKAIDWTNPQLFDPIAVFILLGIISIGMKYKGFVKYRGLFLLLGIAWLGFYRGACNCMIGSFQSLILNIMNWNFIWIGLLWIGILIVATYLFGRIWCGWLCHLGGIQEFLYRSPKLKILSSDRSQSVLQIIRYAIFAFWVLQLVVMKTNIFCHYDPFKTLFNMMFNNSVDIILVAVLLLSSVLIYRPFCRSICPVGVLLGWVSRLPGARKMKIESSCVSCGQCKKECAMHAIKKDNTNIINPEICIACGDCKTVCRKGSIKLK